MEIDLTKLITNLEDTIDLDISLDNNYNELLNETSIKKLKNTKFKGMITKLYDDSFELEGIIEGTMILADDITLEDVDYEFKTEIEEKFSEFNQIDDNNLKIIKNRLDISDFLWQNILVEIPLKVKDPKNENLKLEGNGWRLITEEELKQEKSSPFDELKDKFN